MKDILIHKLRGYIKDNNPDLLLHLEEEGCVTSYLTDKLEMVASLPPQLKDQPEYIIEEVCLDILTSDLRPSKFHYISNILEENFEEYFRLLQQSGTLRYEVINLINACESVFEEIGFTEETEDNWQLRYLITGTISE